MIVARHDPGLVEWLETLPIPVIAVSNTTAAGTLPLVGNDEIATGVMAAQHLLDLGCRNLAYVWNEEAYLAPRVQEGRKRTRFNSEE